MYAAHTSQKPAVSLQVVLLQSQALTNVWNRNIAKQRLPLPAHDIPFKLSVIGMNFILKLYNVYCKATSAIRCL